MKRQEAAIRGIAAVALAWLLLSLSPLARAQTNPKQVDIDIGEMPLTLALQEFSKQTGLQHLYLPTDKTEEEIVVGPVRGHFTASEILTRLLPVGFTFSWSNDRTVAVLSPLENVPPGGVKPERTATDQQHSELSTEQQLSMANGGGRSGSARGPYAFEGKMLVEASKIFDDLDLDIPTTVIDRDDIDASGVSTLADLMGYITQQPYVTSESLLGDGTQVANLRGLGFDTTLVLINGHRTTATASSLSFNAFDMNSIPLGAVERIEIVSDSTSAMYGADAIGGVLKIVLRENIPEPRLDVDYGAAAGGGVERHAAFGASGSSGRARGSVVLDYFDRSPLLGRERDRFNNQDFRRFGGMDWRSTIAAPGNVRSASLDNLPGLPSSFAGIPAVTAGMSLTPSDFLATAGQQNLESLYKYQGISYARTRKGLTAQGEYAITPGTSLYGEFMYVDRDSAVTSEPPALAGVLVPRANPHNPFGEDVVVDVLLTGLRPRTSTHRSEMARAVGGARGRIRDWNWEASLHHSQDRDVAVRTNDLDSQRVAEALSATDAQDALNLFGGRGANSGELLASLLAEPARHHSRADTTQVTAYLRGPLFLLPAGRVDLIVGSEWREERVQYVVPSALQDISGSHQRAVGAAFGELQFPILDSSAKIPGVNHLSLVLSGRLDNYSDVGDSFNPEYALLWRPVAALGVRASWSQGFRPPPLVDLYLPRLDVRVPTVDPARHGELALPTWRAGGNAELKPSNAESFATSARFTPPGLPGLHLGASYWRIHVDETIGIPSPEQLLSAESLFDDRIIRREPSAEDIEASVPGRLELIDIRRLNYGSVSTSGIDFNVAMDLDTDLGRFRPDLSATWVHDFTTSDLVAGSGVSRVGVANLQGSIMRWRAVAGLKWNRGGFGMSGAVRYLPSYDDVAAFGGQTDRRIGSQTLVDLQLSMDLGEFAMPGSPWNDFEIRAGALNLFDAQPPFAEVGLLAGHDPSQGDLRQRFWYLKLAKKF